MANSRKAPAKAAKDKPEPKGSGSVPAKLRLLFPHPGKFREWQPPKNEDERRRLQNELHDYEMQCLTHRAVHTNDPDARSRLASHVQFTLRQSLEPGPTLRKWLSFVLNRLDVHGAIPHLAKDNTVKVRQRIERIRGLARYMIEHPTGTLKDRLTAAGKHLGCSYETGRGHYYSDSFRAWMLFEQASKQSKPT